MRRLLAVLVLGSLAGGLFALDATTPPSPTPTALVVSPAGGPAGWSGGYPVELTATFSSANVTGGTVTFTVADAAGNPVGSPAHAPPGTLAPSGNNISNGSVVAGRANALWLVPAGTPAQSLSVAATYSGTASWAAASASSTLVLKDYSPQLPQPPATPLAYDVIYCRAPRDPSGLVHTHIAEVGSSNTDVQPGTDLVLLHPDGTQEVVVSSANGTTTPDAVGDPFVSFDATKVYFTRYRMKTSLALSPVTSVTGADVYAVSLAKIGGAFPAPVRLTDGGYSPNKAAQEGAADWPVINSCPCPTADGRIVFVSNRSRYRPNKNFTRYAMQLFRMNADGTNVEKIAPMNLGSALHPFPLRNGQIAFSSYEAQGLRDLRSWSLWGIDPDGTGWFPLWSQLTSAHVLHFGTQLSDGRVVSELYYNDNERGFGSLYAWPEPGAAPAFGPAYPSTVNAPNPPVNANVALGTWGFRFMPAGLTWLTPWTIGGDSPTQPLVAGDKNAPGNGRFTHPQATVGGDLLAVWSPGPCYRGAVPSDDAGIYLLKTGGQANVNSPSQMVKVLNDPNYCELWPRPVVPYAAIYGTPTPKVVVDLANDGTVDRSLPEGTPYGLIGTASLSRREDFPNGVVKSGTVTATNPVVADTFFGLDFPYHKYGNSGDHWTQQGSTSNRWSNDKIRGIRILGMDPSTAPPPNTNVGIWANYANERVRILGEIPVYKGPGVLDPDGNPDTSFLAKIPADRPFQFQLLDQYGLALNTAQTWHQVRPGEKRYDCGGCHAHSQKPTDFNLTAAARPDYVPWDLTDTALKGRPLFTSKANDQSGGTWDAAGVVGIRYQTGGEVDVEFNRDIQPILAAKCVSCHGGATPAANLAFDLTTTHQTTLSGNFALPINNAPANYITLANGRAAQSGGYLPSGNKLLSTDTNGTSRFGLPFRARLSQLAWKAFGARLDDWLNSDFPTETTPGDLTTVPLTWKFWDGSTKTFPTPQGMLEWVDFDYVDGGCQASKVLTDDEKHTFGRWIDLGYPIDMTGNGTGWLMDDQPPTLALPYPVQGPNATALTKLVVGACDTGSGLALAPVLTADFPVDGIAPGSPVPLTATGDGRWTYTLQTPITSLTKGTLTLKAQDRAGNRTSLVRTASVNSTVPPPPSPPTPAAVTLTVPAFTTTASPAAQTLTVTATTTPVVNEGALTFSLLSGTTPVGTPVSVTVVNGIATGSYTLPAGQAAGTYTVFAAYAGTANFAAASATGTLTVQAAPPPPPPANPNQATIDKLNAVIADLQSQIVSLQAAVNTLQNPVPPAQFVIEAGPVTPSKVVPGKGAPLSKGKK